MTTKNYYEVDSKGYPKDLYTLGIGDSIPENFKEYNLSFFKPRWDFKQKLWVEDGDITGKLLLAKEAKKEELGLACQEAILGRFPSQHQGTDYSFSYDKEAQSNFAERWNLFQNNMLESMMLTAKTIPGDEVKRILVTRDEFTIIYLDSVKHKENCISRLQDLLVPMVNNAVSLKQLVDMHWTNISLYPGEPSIVVKDDATLAKGVKKAGDIANLAKDSSDLTTTAFMEAMGLLFGGMM